MTRSIMFTKILPATLLLLVPVLMAAQQTKPAGRPFHIGVFRDR
jgi:hypothetical protein